MRKLILLLIFCIFSLFVLPAKADIIPLSSKNIKYYGIGVLNMPKSYTVYQYPYNDSKVLREVNYESIKKSAIVNSIDMRKISYVAYVPSNNVALLTVDLNPENNWYCVFLNQETGETGWVYNDDKDAFLTYRGLFYKYGKKYGIRMFNDLPKDDKVLYAKESKNSQVLEQLTYPKYISFTVIHGNWLLASVNDMTKQAKVGWFNWRNDDGTLNMFPNFKD
ncbi:MAG: hypothetical protein LUH05_03440 [Candidatus Gastranaerophilales bacterium]|nr:hypothetical protein [Candidatus Gastranaerophilales bacterium]